MPLLPRRQRPRDRFALQPGRPGDPPPPRVRQLRPAVHHLRTARRDHDQGRQEGRLPRPLRPREDQTRPGAGLLEAADQQPADRDHHHRDRERNLPAVRERSAKPASGRARDALPPRPRRSGLRPLRQRLPPVQRRVRLLRRAAAAVGRRKSRTSRRGKFAPQWTRRSMLGSSQQHLPRAILSHRS